MSREHAQAAIFKPGGIHRTRDRREARIERISQPEGLISGEVQMHGSCTWRLDGRYRDAPFGAPGPLDLMPPAEKPAAAPKSASLKEALEGDNRLFCCD